MTVWKIAILLATQFLRGHVVCPALTCVSVSHFPFSSRPDAHTASSEEGSFDSDRLLGVGSLVRRNAVSGVAPLGCVRVSRRRERVLSCTRCVNQYVHLKDSRED